MNAISIFYIRAVAIVFFITLVCFSPLLCATEKEPVDLQKLREMARGGSAQAQYDLGYGYIHGKFGLETNQEEGIKWVRYAAEKGHADDQRVLGGSYLFGTNGCKTDEETGFKWLMNSALQGNMKAAAGVGYCYDEGVGVKKDLDQAVKWYSKLAMSEDDDDSALLITFYEQATGSAKNEARMALDRLLLRYENEYKRLSDLAIRNRDAVSKGKASEAYQRMLKLKWLLYPASIGADSSSLDDIESRLKSIERKIDESSAR
jgi:TPR repeat protein